MAALSRGKLLHVCLFAMTDIRLWEQVLYDYDRNLFQSTYVYLSTEYNNYYVKIYSAFMIINIMPNTVIIRYN